MFLSTDWRPASAADRIRVIDILRGLALFGVLIVNILTDFRVPMLEHAARPFDGARDAGWWVEVLAAGLLEFKSLTIFSFLFGAGIAIQLERAGARGVHTTAFLMRRCFWLLVFGAAHLFLIWNGDILTLYAVCGLLLAPLVRLRWEALLAMGVAWIVLPEFYWIGSGIPSGAEAASLIARAREVYGDQGWWAITSFRWRETWALIVPILIMVMPRTLGLIFCGVAAWKSGILRETGLHRGKLAAAVAIGGVIGGAITVNDVWAKAAGSAPWSALRDTHLDAPALLAMAYVAAFLLLPKLPAFGLAALGQMAFTNYIMQSIILGFVFYGYGLGMFGRASVVEAAGIGVAIYGVQAMLSVWWLRRFRFGPMEWLWRSLTYGRWQPMRVEGL